MSGYDLSICVFIRDAFKGAFCLFESMKMLMPLADEFIVMDLGSTDGTLETLQSIAEHNKKLRIIKGEFPVAKPGTYTPLAGETVDASAFAVLANDLIVECSNKNVLYYQSDEIWHEDLVEIMKSYFDVGVFDLSFWRIQYRENFQKVKWYPHPVHRVGQKDNFNFVGDGMNTDRHFEPEMCSNWGMEWFMKWSDEYTHRSVELPTNEMILDVSLIGGFLDNIPDRRFMHAPFWHEQPDIEGKPLSDWMAEERKNENWDKKHTPFKIPRIMRDHVGQTRYKPSSDTINFLKWGGVDWRN